MKAIEDEIDITKRKDNIIDGIMKSLGLYCLVSDAKVGKSMFAIQLAYALTTGQQFLGHNTMPSPVIYITTESDHGQLKERAKFLNLEFPPKSLFIIDRDGKGQINISEHKEEIKKLVKEKEIKLMIIDMLKDVNLEIEYDINNYQDIGQKLLPKLREICEECKISILFTHHLNKHGTILGSTAFDAVVDGKITLTPDKSDKSLIRLNMINRDFPELDIQLKKNDNQIFSLYNQEVEEEINYNLIQIINYVSNNNDCEFTCSDVIKKLKLNITPKQLGRLINSNIKVLASEGVTITKNRTGNARLYSAHYVEPIDEEDKEDKMDKNV